MVTYRKQDIVATEKVQKHFTKRFVGLKSMSYQQRLTQSNLHSLELRRLLIDLIWCYKVLFGLVNLDCKK